MWKTTQSELDASDALYKVRAAASKAEETTVDPAQFALKWSLITPALLLRAVLCFLLPILISTRGNMQKLKSSSNLS